MAVKTLAGVKRLAIIGVALLGFLVIVNWAARAGTSNPYTVIVAQNETQTSPKEKTVGSPESQESESKTDEKQESTGDKKKPLKDFHPSEKIEAEQAVDFPYDI
jgi:cytoskeletal protein RodZ